MAYMAVGSRQILFNDTQAPAMAPPVATQNNNNPVENPDRQESRPSTTPVFQEHIGQNIDLTA